MRAPGDGGDGGRRWWGKLDKIVDVTLVEV